MNSIAWNYAELRGIAQNCAELRRIARNCSDFRRISVNCMELHGIKGLAIARKQNPLALKTLLGPQNYS